jgi:hypothetical protein
MHGNAEFFAPLIEMRPSRGRPPVIRNLSMIVVAFEPAQIKGNMRFVEGF